MDMMEIVANKLSGLNPRMAGFLEKYLKKIPAVRRKIDNRYDGMLAELEQSAKPYRNEVASYTCLPETGRERAELIEEMAKLQAQEEARWQDGFVSGAVYHGDRKHIELLNQVYALYSQSNPLHADLWPSITKFEAEIVSMTANILGASAFPGTNGIDDRICGTVTSGGTESILLAMKTYRDRARQVDGIKRPEIVAPTSVHAAFEKAAQYFGLKLITVPIASDFRADIEATAQAITKNTIVVVGSAPSFPHGVIDPIEELSSLAFDQGIGFHTDCCLGGFVLPWAKKLGYDIPAFDFSLPGVTSMSADTHKFGYAAKGTSVVLYRNYDLRHYQYYITANWPGGLYFSPTLAGSRPGALSAVCWAAMVSMGEQGYLDATAKILKTAKKIKDGLANIPELRILGDPLWVIAFTSDSLDIYQVMEFMTRRNWNLNGLHKPTAVHLCVTLRHTQPGVIDCFLGDLNDAVNHVKLHPDEKRGMAPVYGMAATMPFRGLVSELLQRYLDVLYKV